MSDIVAIAGSPRRGGNSDILLDHFLKGAKNSKASIEKFVLSELNIKPCDSSYSCKFKGVCVVQDDWEKVHQAVLLIVEVLHLEEALEAVEEEALVEEVLLQKHIMM